MKRKSVFFIGWLYYGLVQFQCFGLLQQIH